MCCIGFDVLMFAVNLASCRTHCPIGKSATLDGLQRRSKGFFLDFRPLSSTTHSLFSSFTIAHLGPVDFLMVIVYYYINF